MTTEQQNKMLDKFIGSEGQWESYKNSYGEECWGKYKPNYHHSDWNELMRVVEKINTIERFEVVIMSEHCHITDQLGELTLSLQCPSTKIAVYKACCEFIKWYNDENRDN